MRSVFVAASLLAIVASAAAQIDPLSLAVTDPHVHLVDPALGFHYTWASRYGGGPTCHQDCAVCTGMAGNTSSDCNIYRDWTVQDYLMAQPFNATKLVFMEVSTNTTMANLYGVREAQWVQGLADTTQPLIKGIVARCPLEVGAAVEPCLAQVAQLRLVRGIRSDFTTVTVGNTTTLSAPFVAGVTLLAKYGLSFELLVSTALLPLVLQLIVQVPNVKFILDHMGGPSMANPADFGPWQLGITALAAQANVFVKVSGGPQGYGGPAWTLADVQPYVAHLLQTFGPPRAFYAGNWFWVNNYDRLSRWSMGIWALTAGLSDADKVKFYSTTAAAVYRLD